MFGEDVFLPYFRFLKRSNCPTESSFVHFLEVETESSFVHFLGVETASDFVHFLDVEIKNF
jgi:hypothetical protein